MTWIKIHRKLLDSPLIKKPEHFTVWIALLMMANHKDQEIIFNNRKMRINAGSFVTSRLKISQQCGLHQSQVQRILEYLEIEQQIEQVNLGTGRLISITNWEKYQIREQLFEQPVNSYRTASEQPVNTNKNDKNDKNEKKNTLHQTSFDGAFDEFWNLYPRKVGKAAARKAWKSHFTGNGTMDQIKSTLEWQRESDQWTQENGRFIPHPSTWINQERWMDEKPQEDDSVRKFYALLDKVQGEKK